jgi:hypothetical protein
VRNINKDYLVVVNVKTAETKAPSNMKFHVTDILTCNIFFQLEFNDHENNLVNLYAPREYIEECELILRVVKPDGAHKEMIITEPLDEKSNLYCANLGTDFINVIGICECELFINAKIRNNSDGSIQPEINTTEMFEYEVVKSVFSDLRDVVESDPNLLATIDSLATKDFVVQEIKKMDDYGFATRDYVNQVVIGGDLSDYVTDQELEDALKNFTGGSLDLSEYVTEQELQEALVNFSTGGTVSLSGYVTKTEMNELLENKADSEHTHEDYITNEELTNREYATKDQIPTSLPADGGNADNANTVGGYGIWVGTRNEYYAIEEISDTVLYFIKEDE